MKVLKPLALCVVLLAGCGGGGDDGKDLFSVWTRDGDGATVDLTKAQFSTPAGAFFISQDGSQCNCVLTIIGTQSNGTIARNQCYYVRGSSSRDPGCAASNGAANYTNGGGVLTLSASTGTFTFR